MTQQDELLQKLKNTPSDNLSKGVASVDRLDEKDYDDAQRASKHHLNQNWNKIISALHWVLFWSGVALTLSAVIIIIILLYVYISDVIKTPSATKELLSILWNTVLIVGATLFIEQLTHKK